MPSRLPHIVAVIAALLVAPAMARSQPSGPGATKPSGAELAYVSCAKVPADKPVQLGKYGLKTTMTFYELLALTAKLTCKRFVIRPDLRLKDVNVFVSVPMSPRQIFRLFAAAIYTVGASVVASGPVLKVAQVNNLVLQDTEYYGSDARGLPRDDRVITKVIRPRHVSARSLLPILNKMKHHRESLTYHLPSNTIILAGGSNNMRRLVKIVDELDVPLAKDGVWMVRLEHLDAAELKAIMLQLFFQNPLTRLPRLAGQGPRKGALPSASKIIAEPSINALLFVARGADFARIRKLIDKLDQRSSTEAKRKLHVVKLQHADAETLAQVLASVVGTSSGRRRTRSRSRSSSVRRRLQRYLGRSKSKKGPLFAKQVQITADKATSSIVVAATLADFLRLRPLIKQLDIPRRQVFVEMAILELTLSHEQRLGLAYHGGGIAGSGDSQAIIFGGVQHSGLGSLLLDLSSLQGLGFGVRGAQVDGSAELLGLQADIPGLGVMLQALATDSNVNVLSAPHLLTTNNEQAEISVGQNLPFQGALGGLNRAGLSLPTISVQRQDVALKVKLTPHIGARGTVRIELEAEISDISSPNYNGLGPATSKRTTKTTLVLSDQQSAIVGGLRGTRLNESVSKVPLLGDIPLLGYLFKQRTKTRQRTAILFVLTPYVIRDANDLRRIFKRKLVERDRFIRRFSAVTRGRLRKDINYRHKHGLLAEIDAVARKVERDVALVAAAQQTLGSTPRTPSGPRKAPPVPAASDD